jgi:hypothetical protein
MPLPRAAKLSDTMGPVLVRMWPGWAQSRPRSSRCESSPGADVAGVGPVQAQKKQGRRASPALLPHADSLLAYVENDACPCAQWAWECWCVQVCVCACVSTSVPCPRECVRAHQCACVRVCVCMCLCACGRVFVRACT